jgi:hypothetical protein
VEITNPRDFLHFWLPSRGGYKCHDLVAFLWLVVGLPCGVSHVVLEYASFGSHHEYELISNLQTLVTLEIHFGDHMMVTDALLYGLFWSCNKSDRDRGHINGFVKFLSMGIILLTS